MTPVPATESSSVTYTLNRAEANIRKARSGLFWARLGMVFQLAALLVLVWSMVVYGATMQQYILGFLIVFGFILSAAAHGTNTSRLRSARHDQRWALQTLSGVRK